ncbi:hypothetical protein, partial [Paenibacillus plantarum]|uniref:hypothetical protein n=1 Tax=Paenibacillus plantarum TaxID=2654975 RepID=UPI0014920D12
GGTGSLGDAASITWNVAGTEMTITLGGSGIDVKYGDTLTIATGSLRNIGGEGVNGTTVSAVIKGSFGQGVAPALDGTTPVITPYNATNYRGESEKQYFDLKFADATNKVQNDDSTANVKVKDGSNGNAVVGLGTDGSAVWQDSQTLRVTIGDDSIIHKGNFTVEYDAVADGLKDVTREIDATGTLSTSLSGA